MAKGIWREYPDGRKDYQTTYSYRAWVVRAMYVPVAIGVMILGGIFGSLGVVLVYLGAKGDTHLKLFGQSLETADVGVASIFVGAVTVVMVIRRVLKSSEKLAEVKDETEREVVSPKNGS